MLNGWENYDFYLYFDIAPFHTPLSSTKYGKTLVLHFQNVKKKVYMIS